MTVTKKEIVNGITVYTVEKNMDDAKADNLGNRFVTNSMIDFIIRDHDADVLTVDGNLLLRFRKNALTQTHTKEFYDNVIDFAEKQRTSTRTLK